MISSPGVTQEQDADQEDSQAQHHQTNDESVSNDQLILDQGLESSCRFVVSSRELHTINIAEFHRISRFFHHHLHDAS
jgi:hypothetical protein